MAITLDPSEYIAALGDLTPLVNDSMGGMQGVDILNQFAGGGGGSYNIPNGGFARPVATTDPTYSSGYDYARSIAGGMPMSQVIAPGVSYSPEQPGGYTQADLNIAAGMTPPPPPPPPVYQQPDDPSFFGTGIGGVTIPGGRRDKMPPLRNIFDNLGGGKSGPGYDSIGMPTVGNGPGFFDPNYSLDKLNIDKYRTKVPPSGSVNYGQAGQQTKPLGTDVTGYKVPAEQEVQVPPQEFNIEQIRQDIADSGIDFTNLFGLPQAPDLSQFVTKDDLPTGRDFSIENLGLPDFSKFVTQEDLPVYNEPDLSQFITQQDLPTFNPQNYRDDFLSIAREGIEMPSYDDSDIRDLIGGIDNKYSTGLDELNRNIGNIPSYDDSDIRDLIGGIDNKYSTGLDELNRNIGNIPTYRAPDLSAYDTRLADLEKTLLSLQQPTGGNFSVNQPQVRGLF